MLMGGLGWMSKYLTGKKRERERGISLSYMREIPISLAQSMAKNFVGPLASIGPAT